MSTREAIRAQKREISKENRALQRQILQNKREGEKIQMEMKAAAKRGDMTTVKQLAKQLIQIQKQEDRMKKMSGTLKTMEFKVSQQGAQATISNAVATMNGIMGKMNSKVDVKEMQNIIRQFSKENEQMSMKEDMLETAMDDIFDDEDLDEEMDEAMESIFDEIGLETKAKLGSISLSNKKLETTQIEEEDELDDDLMKRLNKLKG